MSRWSADRLRIALVPGEIALARGTHRRALPAGREASSLLITLDEALADAAWQAARVEVVLSQHFVRHVLTPPPGAALAATEERALVAASLREIYGELAQAWDVRVHSQPPHAGLLGAAVDSAFVRALDTLLARHGFRKVTIRPLASLAVRRAPNRLNGWWILVEPGWISLFGAASGIWRHVAGLPSDDTWHARLPELVARECGSAAMSLPPSAWIQPLGMGAVSAPRNAHLYWQVLPHDAQSSAAHALLAI